MLATMSNRQPDMSTMDQSYRRNSSADSTLGMEDRLCPGCKKSAVNENGGLVVAFGQSFFHVDCFKCAKCGDQVTADTNLLLLSDGSPICANCSYSCNVCHLPILDEAIMTGDDSYHAHCFKCKVCKNRIDELVFAKTTQGIYCMNCHSERMIKIRRHAQKKAEREKAAGGSSSKSREHDQRVHHKENGVGHSSRDDYSRSDSLRTGELSHRPSVRSSSKRSSGPYVGDAFEAQGSTLSPPPPQSSQKILKNEPSSFGIAQPTAPDHHAPAMSSSPSQRQPVFSPPTSDSAQRPTPEKQLTLPIVASEGDSSGGSMKGRKSHDDGVRPVDVLLSQMRDSPEVSPTSEGGLRPADVPSKGTSRGKRRSINPGLVLSNTNVPVQSGAALSSSPSAMTFGPKSPAAYGFSSRVVSPERHPPRRPKASTPNDSPILNNFTTSPTPMDNFTSPDLQKPKSHTASGNMYGNDEEQSGPSRTHRPPLPADKVPPRTHSLSNAQDQVVSSQRSLSPANHAKGHVLRSQRSFDDRPSAGGNRLSSHPSLNLGRSRSASRSGPSSPTHRADVPYNVESGTDTDAEGGGGGDSVHDHEYDMPPALPPKSARTRDLTLSTDVDPDASAVSQTNSADGSDEMMESSTVQRTSHTTFIAPALPPIRFSMNGADFTELLGPAGLTPSIKALEQLAKLSEDHDEPSLTPPSSASSFDGMHRPMSDITIVGNPDGQDATVVLGTNSSSSHRSDLLHRASESQSHSRIPDSSPSQHTTPAEPSTRITLTEPGSNVAVTLRQDVPELVMSRLRGALVEANERGIQHLKLDKAFVDAILSVMHHKEEEYSYLKGKFDGVKRTSKQYIEGLTVAQAEYDRELKARRDAEAEVTRLRVLISGQAARLTSLSGDVKRQELREQLSKQLHDDLTGLEQDLSKLRVERDVALAEMEELSASKSSPGSTEVLTSNTNRLTVRFENIKSQYQRELIPLTQQRESLARELAELKAVRDELLEETTVLSARNEELAQLSAQYSRRMDAASDPALLSKHETPRRKESISFDKPRPSMQSLGTSQSLTLTSTRSSTYSDEPPDSKLVKAQKPEAPEFPTPASRGKFMKWPGSSKAREVVSAPVAESNVKGKSHPEHSFQQLSILRFTRCDHCGDKMWGSQVRCSVCNISVHGRCMNNVQLLCSQQSLAGREDAQNGPPQPSLFGRDLTDQVKSDSKGGPRHVPIIVEKCIEAVELIALDYEGIYRKTGGSGQSKAITQLFERGDYAAFDLRDSDRFNDICSVTSVLKTYFRSLPVPLLTYDLHDNFMRAVGSKDVPHKHKVLLDLVKKLPKEHYYTLRMLMLHLHRVREQSEKNLMTSRNLGVVFGPTLMRSRDPAAEFSDMAGKALTVEWLIENATLIFNQSPSN